MWCLVVGRTKDSLRAGTAQTPPLCRRITLSTMFLLASEVPAIAFTWSSLRKLICESVGWTEDALLPEQRKRLHCAAKTMARMIMLLACEVPAIGFAWSGLRRHICDSVGRTEDVLLPEQRKRLHCAANVMRRMIMLLASGVPAIGLLGPAYENSFANQLSWAVLVTDAFLAMGALLAFLIRVSQPRV